MYKIPPGGGGGGGSITSSRPKLFYGLSLIMAIVKNYCNSNCYTYQRHTFLSAIMYKPFYEIISSSFQPCLIKQACSATYTATNAAPFSHKISTVLGR